MNAPIFSHTRWFFAARCAGVAALAFNSSLSARAASVDDPPADSKSAASFGQTLRRAWTGAWMGEVRAPAADGAASPSMPVTLIVRPGLPAPLVEVTIMRAGAMANMLRNATQTSESYGCFSFVSLKEMGPGWVLQLREYKGLQRDLMRGTPRDS